jgi:sugar phosphate isomerase/epimerase
MRPIGFSTGALARGDFARALAILTGRGLPVVELSALREAELPPLVAAAPRLDLAEYTHVAVHAPGRTDPAHECEIVAQLGSLTSRGWPVVVHPDAVHDWQKWKPLGPLLLVENMDRRKDIGRTAHDLEAIFDLVPEAGLCFDVGHARQCDTSMTEAFLILRRFGARLKQIHLSEVTSRSTHDRLSFTAIRATQEIADLIPDGTPVVLEAPVEASEIDDEVARAMRALAAPASGERGRSAAGHAWPAGAVHG